MKCFIFQGSEDTIHRQLRFLFKREQTYIEELKQKEEPTEGLAGVDEEVKQPEIKMFKRMKLLMMYSSITIVSNFTNLLFRVAIAKIFVTQRSQDLVQGIQTRKAFGLIGGPIII